MGEALVREGMVCEAERRVEARHLAEHLVGRGIRVVSTPSLLYFAESTVRECLEEALPPGLTSVGVWASIRHLARAPEGALLRVRGTILSAQGRRVSAYISIAHGDRLVAEVFHERRIIEEEKLRE